MSLAFCPFSSVRKGVEYESLGLNLRICRPELQIINHTHSHYILRYYAVGRPIFWKQKEKKEPQRKIFLYSVHFSLRMWRVWRDESHEQYTEDVPS
jgi:hypothetical protein